MANSVNFPPNLGGDNSTYTDDDSPTTGLANGGAVIRLIPMFSKMISVMQWVINSISTSLSSISESINTATAQANAAANSANAALVSQNAAATSVTQVNTLGAATGLQTTGAVVVVSTAKPPISDQVLMANNATSADWESLPDSIFPNSYYSFNGVI